MSPSQDDPLYAIFLEHLHSGRYDQQPVETFLRDVVDYYWRELTTREHVPQRMVETVRGDLTADVQDMLRVKIYGHYGIQDYNRSRKAG